MTRCRRCDLTSINVQDGAVGRFCLWAGISAELALEGIDTGLILPKRVGSPPAARQQFHQFAVCWLACRIHGESAAKHVHGFGIFFLDDQDAGETINRIARDSAQPFPCVA